MFVAVLYSMSETATSPVLICIVSGSPITIHIADKRFVALVRKQSMPTERSPLVGEVSANFCG
jgi:hypothetical protein